MKIIRATLLFMFLTLSYYTQAQDPHFSQYFSNPIYLNPAFTGTAGCSRIASSFRDQWPNINGTYITTSISYDQYVHPLRSGLGFEYMYDNAGKGALQSHIAQLAYSFPIKIKKEMILVPAINIGMGVRTIDYSRLTHPEPFDGILYIPFIDLPEKLKEYYFNLGAGLIYNYRNFVVGLAADHLNRPNVGFYGHSRRSIRYTVHLSGQFDIKKIASISPTVILQSQGSALQLLPALMTKVWYIKAGFGGRFDPTRGNWDSVISMLGFQNKWMSIGYSYDYTVSSLSNATTGGSHELSMVYKFNCKNKTDKFNIPQINGF